jgi:Ca2+-binding RTX toxin-like protein
MIDFGADGTPALSADRTTFPAVEVLAGGGDDEVRILQTGGSFADEVVTLDGGGGNDTLVGAIGVQTLIGGSGNDTISGGQGEDIARLGGGNDHFVWNPGDGNDTVEGEAGDDQLDFNGSAANEQVAVSANGARAIFTRNVAAIVMDLGDVEHVAYRALGGADLVTVNDLAGTTVATVDVDLRGFDGQGDQAADTVIATGTEAADTVDVVGDSSDRVVVRGLGEQTRVFGGELADSVRVAGLGGEDTLSMGGLVPGSAPPIDFDGGDGADTAKYLGSNLGDTIQVAANGTDAAVGAITSTTRLDVFAVESLVVLGLGASDQIAAVGNLAALTTLTIDGGPGDDILRGGNGADLLLGGTGNDTVDGNQGTDRALLGTGADRFQWDPGDGNDTVEGEGGTDALDFNGSAIAELIEVSANGARGQLTRNIAAITMDFDDVEGVLVHSFGGNDTITVGDLTGTDVKTVDVDLALYGGGADLAQDTVVVNGTDARDVVRATATGSQIVTSGLAAQTRIVGSEGLNDTLRIQTLAGDDEITVAPAVELLISPVLDLGTDD